MTWYRSAVGPRALAAILLLSGALVGTAFAQGGAAETVLQTTLSGPGNGSGTGFVTLTPDEQQVCYNLAYTLVPPATAAHIHRGAAGTDGPIVVPFDSVSSDNATGCTQGVDAGLIREIIGNPAGFYVNVHNADFPAGAIRGQLGPG
jgi:hypothetical protein